MNKTGEFLIKDARGVEKEKISQLFMVRSFSLKKVMMLTLVILLLNGTRLRFHYLLKFLVLLSLKTIIVGATISEQTDAVTGLTQRVVNGK